MELRGFAEKTKAYGGALADLERAHPGVPPNRLTDTQIRGHVARLGAERRLAWSTVNVYLKATSGTPEQTLGYLGRYTHRVAISDQRILGVRVGNVTFAWRDRADGNALKEMTLTCAEFVGHFLLHVLP
jgi:hypothetical protein